MSISAEEEGGRQSTSTSGCLVRLDASYYKNMWNPYSSSWRLQLLQRSAGNSTPVSPAAPTPPRGNAPVNSTRGFIPVPQRGRNVCGPSGQFLRRLRVEERLFGPSANILRSQWDRVFRGPSGHCFLYPDWGFI